MKGMSFNIESVLQVLHIIKKKNSYQSISE